MSAWATQANKTATVTSGESTSISASPGRLGRALVTTAGSAESSVTFYDGTSPSGIVIGVIPPDASAGTVFEFSMPCVNGIFVSSPASGPALTISYR